MAIANGSPYYMPPANIIRMADELAYLPAYFSEAGDAVIVRHMPDSDFIASREQLFGLHPQLVLPETIPTLNYMTPEPWGWGPRAAALFGNGMEWLPEYKELYGRKTALYVLEELMEKLSFPETQIIPRVSGDIREIELICSDGGYLLKSPWSSSGKGQLRVTASGVGKKEKEWITGVLRQQGYLMIEKTLERTMDFAMLFHMDESRLNYCGLSLFHTGQRGEYKGNYVGSQQKILNRLSICIEPELLDEVRELLKPALYNRLKGKYRGYVGVDMMVYRSEENGAYRIHPCVEINLRYTMGTLALELHRKFLTECAEGVFSVDFHRSSGIALKTHLENTIRHPLLIEEGRIASGYVSLCPVAESTGYTASLLLR